MLYFLYFPIVILAALYLYNFYYEKIEELKTQRSNLMESFKSKYSSLQRIRYDSYNENPRFEVKYKNSTKELQEVINSTNPKLAELEESISKYRKEINTTKQEILDSLNRRLDAIIPLEIQDEPQQPIAAETVKPQSQFEFDGPTENKTLNKEIYESMQMREASMDKISEIRLIMQKWREKHKEVKSLTQGYEDRTNTLLDALWKTDYSSFLVYDKARRLEILAGEISNQTIPMNLSITSVPQMTLEEYKQILSEKLSLLKSRLANIAKLPTALQNSARQNFIDQETYDVLSERFSKRLNGRKLDFEKLYSLDSYEFTKEAFDARVAGKKDLFVYFKFFTNQKIGIYLSMAYPKRTNFARTYHDKESFIVDITKREFLEAKDDEALKQLKTTSNFMLIIGNMDDSRGLWINMNQEVQGDVIRKLNVGQRPRGFSIDEKNDFFTPELKEIRNMEVYQLRFPDQ